MVTPTKFVHPLHIASFKRLALLSIIEGHNEYRLPSKT